MSRKLDIMVRRLVARVGWLRASHRMLWVAGIYLFLCGLLVLALRFVYQIDAMQGLWSLMGLPVALLAAFWWEWRQRPSAEHMLALLDETNHAGGMLMAAKESREAEFWSHTLPSTIPPQFHWEKKKPILFSGSAAAFLLAAFLIPLSFANPLVAQQHKLEIQREMQTLLDQVDALQQTEQLDEEAAQELREALAQLQDNADGSDPERTWEALDDVQRALEEEGKTAAAKQAKQLSDITELQQGAQKLADQMESGASTEELAQTLKDLADRVDEENLERALAEAAGNKDLQEALKKLGDGDPEALKELAKQMKDQLGPEAMKKLAENLQQNQEQLMKGLDELGGKGLIDPKQLQDMLGQGDQGEQGEQGEGEPGQGENGEGGGDLADFLGDPGNQPGGDGMTPAPGGRPMPGRPGRGDITRGPGHGPLNFSHNTMTDGATFKPETLPMQKIEDLRKSQLLGLSMAAPETGGAVDTGSGALSGAKAGTGNAHTHTVYPRHRGAVENFFAR